MSDHKGQRNFGKKTHYNSETIRNLAFSCSYTKTTPTNSVCSIHIKLHSNFAPRRGIIVRTRYTAC